MCKSERKLGSDTIALLQLINTKDKFSVTDDFIQTVRTKNENKINRVIQLAIKMGMVKPLKIEPTITKEFQKLPSISYWQKQLRGSMFKNSDSKGSTTTKRTYLQMVWHFNKWLCGKEFKLKMNVIVGKDTFRQETKTIKFDSIDDLLQLLSEPFAPRVEIIKIIKTYLLDDIHLTKSKSYMIVISSAIKSFFEKNEYPLEIKYKCNVEETEDLQSMSLSDVMTLLTNGTPSILEKAVFMSKFHRGLDASTLVDRFNFEAWDQIVKWFGSENIDSWDLEKCPVPIKLVRVKTSYAHIGFLDRDAIESIQAYVKYKTQKYPNIEIGSPLFVNKFGRPITLGWVFEKFARLSKNSGLRIPTGKKGQYKVDSHEFRDLLKSTLIDAGCRMDISDHVIGHMPKDSYEKQAKLYPETLRKEYAKASKRLNIFTKFSNVVSGKDDADELRLELKEKLSEMEKIKERSLDDEAEKIRHDKVSLEQARQMKLLQDTVNELKKEVRQGRQDKELEFCCADCNTIHRLQECPACNSKMKRIYQE